MKTSMNLLVLVATLFFAGSQLTAQTAVSFTAPFASKEITTTSAIVAKNGGTVVSNIQEGAAIVKLNGKFGLINAQGQEICRPVYQTVQLFNHGYAAVKRNGLWGFINKQGFHITKCRFNWVGTFNGGYAPVQINGKWGFINEQGYEVFTPQFDQIKSTANGRIIAKQNNEWFFLDFNAKTSISLSSDSSDRA